MILCPYKEGEESQIQSLFHRCFNRRMSESFWRWRFLENPNGNVMIYLAWDESVLAAHYAVSPIMVSVEGCVYCTGLSLTTMTHPEYRGLKLFPQLATRVYDHLASLQYLMVWGFPNHKSHKTFIKDLLWRNVYEIPTMQVKVSERMKNSIDKPETDDKFKLNYEDVHFKSNLIHVRKDLQYLQWRYEKHPTNRYVNYVIASGSKVSSYCILKIYNNSLDIVDFQAKNREEGDVLLRQALSFAYSKNLETVNCWAPRHHFLHSICEKHGFTNKEPITYLGFRQLHEKANVKVSDNYTDWFIQMGDSDVY